jgi:hypothetical protein
MKSLGGIILAFVMFGIGMAATQAVESGLSMIKTIPQAATLEYRIKGQVIQSIDIAPGTYQISVKQLH